MAVAKREAYNFTVQCVNQYASIINCTKILSPFLPLMSKHYDLFETLWVLNGQSNKFESHLDHIWEVTLSSSLVVRSNAYRNNHFKRLAV